MSRLNGRKRKVEFETDVMVQGRALVVRAFPTFLLVRLKGTRKQFALPWEAVYNAAAKLEARTGWRYRAA